tara:strand:- start:524 stop:739 length:216 start_codon:yes stop_codon:yes gene_type:complete
MDKLQSDIVERLASKYNKPEHVVEKVIRSQFKLVLDIMQEQKYETIRLRYLGAFGVKPGRLKQLKKIGDNE